MYKMTRRQQQQATQLNQPVIDLPALKDTRHCASPTIKGRIQVEPLSTQQTSPEEKIGAGHRALQLQHMNNAGDQQHEFTLQLLSDRD